MIIVRTKATMAETIAELAPARPHTPFIPCEISTTSPHTFTLPTTGQLIITSAAAIPALTGSTLPVHCVGQKTAEKAKKAGLNVVYAGHTNAKDMAVALTEQYTTPQFFHHATTHQSSTDWYGHLTQHGHALQRHIAYTTAYAPTLPNAVHQALKIGTDLVFFSPKSAEHLIFLATQATLSLSQSTAYCLSDAVAEKCSAVGHIVTAQTPCMNAMKDLLRDDQERPKKHA